MQCVACGKIRPRTISKVVKSGRGLFVVTGLPTDKCEACASAEAKRRRELEDASAERQHVRERSQVTRAQSLELRKDSEQTRDWSVLVRLKAEIVINAARGLRQFVQRAASDAGGSEGSSRA